MNVKFWKNKKVLVTGHTGFKGAWLSQWLHEMGAEVSGLALEPETSPSLFNLLGLEERINSNFGNIQDSALVDAVFNKVNPEIVIHMAAQPLVIRSYQEPVDTYMTNVIGTAHVFEAIRKMGSVKAIVNVTTDKCYENKEWLWGYRENEPMGGHDPYSSSKGCSELLTTSYQKSFFNEMGIKLASARAGNVIGGGDWSDNRLVPDLVRSIGNNEPVIIRSPNATRPWQHVLEPVCGYLNLAEKLYNSQDVSEYVGAYNFGPYDHDVQPVSWIVDALCEKWGPEASWKLDDERANYPHEATYLKLDCSKARAALNWQPLLNLDKALDWIVEWSKAFYASDGILEVTSKQISAYQNLLEEKSAAQ